MSNGNISIHNFERHGVNYFNIKHVGKETFHFLAKPQSSGNIIFLHHFIAYLPNTHTPSEAFEYIRKNPKNSFVKDDKPLIKVSR